MSVAAMPADDGWFIYWRVREADAESAQAGVLRWQALLMGRAPQLEAALWRRAEPEPPGGVTLMEVYTAVPPALADEIAAGPAVAAWQQGKRHVERFVHVMPAVG